jgi:hypothetical protein
MTMQREVLPIPATRKEWLAMRLRYIGASEVAALFNAQPDYAPGRFALWQIKAGRMEPDFTGNARTRAGLALEDAITALAAEQEGWTTGPGFYAAHGRLGATLDRVILAPGPNDKGMAGPGCLELKNVDWIQHKRAWADGEPPMHILLQLQAQLLATGYSWGAVAALVGGNAIHVYRYTARPRLHTDMAARVAAFWASIEAGQAPNADPTDSAWRALVATTPDLAPEPIDLSDDDEATALAAEWMRADAAARAETKKRDEAKHLLVQRVGGFARAVGDGWKLTLSDVAEKPPTVITAEMIGQTIPGRAASRRAAIRGE